LRKPKSRAIGYSLRSRRPRHHERLFAHVVYFISGKSANLNALEEIAAFAETRGVVLSIKEQIAGAVADKPTGVYLLERSGTIGYVGIGVDPAKRINDHLANAIKPIHPWIVDGLRQHDLKPQIVEILATRRDASTLESQLIAKHNPLFNDRKARLYVPERDAVRVHA
jgi:GIY-YIG catalytic domain